MRNCILIIGALFALATPSTVVAEAANNGASYGQPPLEQVQPPPPLNLSAEQRTKISVQVRTDHTKAPPPKGLEQFEPAVGAKVPRRIALNPLPRPLVYEIPELKEYTYLKFKDEILIVNGMNREIVEMIPATISVTR
jgi:hypothetical protein